MLKIALQWINRLFWTLLVTVLVLVATYVSIGRNFIQYVERFQQPLMQRVVSYTGLPLVVDHLSASWLKISPVIHLTGLTLYAPETDASSVLTIDNLSLQLDPIESLLSGRMQVKRLKIAGVECALEQIESGKWQLKGYPAAETEAGSFDNVIDLMLSVDSAELTGTRLQMLYRKGGEALLAVQQLSLAHEQDFRRLRLRATFDDSEQPLEWVIEAKGDPRAINSFSARSHLKLDDVDFAAQLPAVRALGIDIKDARIDAELWLDWMPGGALAAQGKLYTPLLDIAAISGGELAPLKEFKMQFRLEKTVDDLWQGWIPAIQAQWQEQNFSFEQVLLGLDAEVATVSMPALSVERVVQQLARIDLLNDSGRQLLQTLSPKGALANVHLALARQDIHRDSQLPAEQPQFSVRANLVDAGLSPWKGAPGAEGVNGYIELGPQAGMVELDTRDFSLDFPVVYHHSLEFDSGLAQVKWAIGEHRVKVNSGPIYLQAEHGPATGLLALDLPINNDPGDPLMTLVIGLRDSDAKYRNRFIPHTLDQGFLDWMEGSVPAGRVVDAGFIYRGSLSKHGDADRTVQLYLDIEDTSLDYHPDWPALTGIAGLVMIDDSHVDVTADQARLFKLQLSNTRVQASPYAGGGMWLTVDAEAEGSAEDALRIVRESAIRSLVGSVFDNWQLQGDASARVKLAIPLAGAKAEPEIDVKVDLVSSHLSIPEYQLQFDSLAGPINYSSESGIASPGIKGRLYNKPVQATVVQSKSGAVNVTVDGRLAMSDVAAWSRQPAMVFASGETDFRAVVEIAATDNSQPGDSVGQFSVSSNLEGVGIDLPAPYKKTAEQPQPFWLRLPLAGESSLLQMGLEGVAELQLQLAGAEVQSGLLILDRIHRLQHRQGYLTVAGRVENVVIDQWLPIVDKYLAEADRIVAATGKIDIAASASEGLKLSARDLFLVDFHGFGQHFENTLVNAERQQRGWWLSADNDVVTGDVFFPDKESAPLSAKLKRLQLPENILGDDSGEGSGLSSLELTSLQGVSVDVAIGKLLMGDSYYGQLAFEFRGGSSGIRLDSLEGNIRGITIGGRQPSALEWWRDEQGEYSRFYGDYAFGDLGKVLDSWHYESIIESRKGSGTIDLTWPGRPDQWLMAESQGPLFLSVKDGRFLKTSEAAAGTLKVVGIVNFTNLVRRMQLKFSDLYESGISFDNIEGELLLSDGDLIITDDLTVKTPSSRFHLKGRADMQDKQLDMELIATLPVANNLPWIAALAGGLPTAAGVYVASKIFEDQVDRLSSAVYSVKGDWNDPALEFKRVFDDSEKKSRKKAAGTATSQPQSAVGTVPDTVLEKGGEPAGTAIDGAVTP